MRAYPTRPTNLSADAPLPDRQLWADLEEFHRVATRVADPAKQCGAFASHLWPEWGGDAEALWKRVAAVHGRYYSESVAARSAPLGGWLSAAREDEARLDALLTTAKRGRTSAAQATKELAAMEAAAGVRLPLAVRQLVLQLEWRKLGLHDLLFLYSRDAAAGLPERAPGSPDEISAAERILTTDDAPVGLCPFLWAQPLRVADADDADSVADAVSSALDPHCGAEVTRVTAAATEDLAEVLDQGCACLAGGSTDADSLMLVLDGPHRGEVWLRVLDVEGFGGTPISMTPVRHRWFAFPGSDVRVCPQDTMPRASALCLAEYHAHLRSYRGPSGADKSRGSP